MSKSISAKVWRRNRSNQVELLEARRLFAFGQTDVNFGVDGRALTSFASGTFAAAAQDLLVVAGRKILAAGPAGMTRYNSDGSLDTTFGTKGKTIFSGVNYKSIATDSSNRIYALVTAPAGTVVRRYTADGRIDSGFGASGTELVSSTTTFAPSVIDIQDDGKMLVAGTARTDSGNGAKVRVYRLTTDGAGDSSFDGDGIVEFNFGGGSSLTPVNRDKVIGISQLGNGKIIIAGGSTSWAPSFVDSDSGQYIPPVYGKAYFAVARLTPGGSLDSSFNNGIARSEYADEEQVQNSTLNDILPSAFTIGSGDAVYLGTQNNSPALGSAVVAKFISDGSIGWQATAESGSPLFRPNDLAVLRDGRVVVLTSPRSNAVSSNGLAFAAISTDGTFGPWVLSHDKDPETPEVDSYYTGSAAVAVASDGKMLVAGGGSGDAYNNFVVGKYSVGSAADPRPDEFVNARGNDIVRDAEGGLHIAYYDAAANVLKYVYRGPNGLWNAPIIVDNHPNAGQYVSIDVDSKNHAAIAYFDGTNGDMKLATSEGRKWAFYTVESKGSTGLYPSLRFDNSDRPAMTYYRKTGGNLRFAVMITPGVFGYENVETTGDVGRSNVLMASPKNGRYTVAYFDNTTLQVKWASHEKGGKWNIKSAAQTAAGADFISMAYGYNYEPAISYYEAKSGDLKITYYTSAARSFIAKTLATSGAQGLYTQVFFPSYYGQPAVYHYNRSQDKLVLLSDVINAKPSTAATITGGGRYLSLATDANGVPSELAYFDAEANVLKVRSAPAADY